MSDVAKILQSLPSRRPASTLNEVMAQTFNDRPGLSAEQLATLTAAAETAARNAYAPYSRFFVGAALVLDSGEIVTGANVENASYRLTTCAEQAAIATAVCAHGPGIRIRAVLIRNLNNAACSPCGACRQVIAEFAPSDALVFFPDAAGMLIEMTLAELLPAAFLPSSL